MVDDPKTGMRQSLLNVQSGVEYLELNHNTIDATEKDNIDHRLDILEKNHKSLTTDLYNDHNGFLACLRNSETTCQQMHW